MAHYFHFARRASLRYLLLASGLICGLHAAHATPPNSPANGQRDAAAEQAWLQHGFTESQRDSLRATLDWGLDQKFVPGGALLIIHRGEPVLREGFGVADLETNRPFLPDAPCRIASLTKLHTCTVIALLVEQGKLSWDDP